MFICFWIILNIIVNILKLATEVDKVTATTVKNWLTRVMIVIVSQSSWVSNQFRS